jgi:hypothetical protein
MSQETRRLVTARMKVGESGELEYIHQRDKIMVREWRKTLPAGSVVDVTMELELDEATGAQIKKIHAMIGEIADAGAIPFDEAKLLVKKRCGMAIEFPVGGGKTEWQIKSLAACSKKEISNAIEAAILVGDHLKLNLRLK